MTPVGSPRGGLELVWVNASPSGPTSGNSDDPQHHHIVRVQHGRNVTIARSSSSDRATLVNDLDNNIYFPLAKVISREHASIEWLESSPIIKDLGSTHGTYLAHRQATVLATGQIVEDAPLAPLHTLVGILPLRDGDLIQFGKGCSRSEASHHPVRCYVRFLPAPPFSSSLRQGLVPPTAVAVKKAHPYSLLDDPLDSESDVVSIDAETFRAGSSLPAIQSSLAPVMLPSAQTTVVDLSADDDEDVPEMDSPLSASESDSDSGASNHGEHDKSDFSDSASENGFDGFDFQHVPWHHEIKEAAGEKFELDSEAREAKLFGPQYMEAYQLSREKQVVSPGISTHAGSAQITDPLLCKTNAEPVPKSTQATVPQILSPEATRTIRVSEEVEPLVSIDGQVVKPSSDSQNSPNSSSGQDPFTTSLADGGVAMQESRAQEPSIQADDVFQVAASESGANVDSDEPVLARKRKVHHVDDNRAEDFDGNDTGSSSGHSVMSMRPRTPGMSSSGSPSPSKRRRNTQPDQGCRGLARTSSRGRKLGGFVAKAMYATGLLSVGFFTGSLFTFKSLMNAAAAANAAGSSSR